ncbi:MAG TPA: TRAP transporter large permease [Actinomycetales bacterium]|nr:TRAP transporter large permease [Actinomycetales bacterium]
MSNGMLVIAILLLMLSLMAIRMPIAFALGISGAVGLVLLRSFDHATATIGSVPFTQVASFSLTIIPMFTLMGMFAVKAKVAEQVYQVAAYVFRKFPGGLGVATVMACAGFAAVSGSSIGTAATMSKLSVGEMRKHGYPLPLATATVAVAGTLGVLIPPSVILVLYAIMTGLSVGQVLAAGIIPGILSAVAYSVYIIIASRRTRARDAELAAATADELEASREPELAAVLAEAGGSSRTSTSDIASHEVRGRRIQEAISVEKPVERLRDLPMRGVIRVMVLFVIVLGGMYSGVFTPTESAAIGALVAGTMLIAEMWKEGPRAMWTAVVDSLKETAGTTSMVFSIIVGSSILSSFFVLARVPRMLADGVMGWGLSPTLTLIILLATLLPLGMMLETISILVITVPLIYPVAIEFGFSGIWLGVIFVKLIEIGMVTPPVGINCFVVAGTAGVKVDRVFAGVLPFVIVDLAVIAILFAFPDIVLWLPDMVRI